MNKLTIFIFILFLIVGCSNYKEFNPPEPQLSNNYSKMNKFESKIDEIEKPDKINPIFVDKEFNESSIEEAEYIVLTPKEYSKVDFLAQLSSTYKKIIKSEEKIINNNIEIFNSLVRLKELNEKELQYYYQNWVSTENELREIKWQKDRNEFIHKIGLYSISILAIVSLL